MCLTPDVVVVVVGLNWQERGATCWLRCDVGRVHRMLVLQLPVATPVSYITMTVFFSIQSSVLIKRADGGGEIEDILEVS